MNYLGIDKCDVGNGLDLGVVLWVAGCDLHCAGCHNQQSWDFNAGKLFSEETKIELFSYLRKPYIKRFTLSGGHPLAPENINDVLDLLRSVWVDFPDLSIWIYSGYTWEELQKIPQAAEILNHYCDVLVDGPYVKEKRNITLAFRGSSNQRVIDVKKSSLEKVVLLDLLN